MPRGTMDDVALETEIGRLPNLSLLELRHRWQTLFGHPAPKSLRRSFLARAVAYQMQVEAYGGLSAATKRRLREIANAVRNAFLFVSGAYATIYGAGYCLWLLNRLNFWIFLLLMVAIHLRSRSDHVVVKLN